MEWTDCDGMGYAIANSDQKKRENNTSQFFHMNHSVFVPWGDKECVLLHKKGLSSWLVNEGVTSSLLNLSTVFYYSTSLWLYRVRVYPSVIDW